MLVLGIGWGPSIQASTHAQIVASSSGIFEPWEKKNQNKPLASSLRPGQAEAEAGVNSNLAKFNTPNCSLCLLLGSLPSRKCAQPPPPSHSYGEREPTTPQRHWINKINKPISAPPHDLANYAPPPGERSRRINQSQSQRKGKERFSAYRACVAPPRNRSTEPLALGPRRTLHTLSTPHTGPTQRSSASLLVHPRVLAGLPLESDRKYHQPGVDRKSTAELNTDRNAAAAAAAVVRDKTRVAYGNGGST
ncbi:hypothetical protein B0H16DRAFT_1449108 [Mycena metata]|uniref:Uncharacterized protein n=1 Tax=Mycena metata TaxID=1033252 RepID=A0AAD7NWV5_9AGAR|nr:hypothetical protein B0H16DRAFT_1449108 [Mycena metata]